MTSRIRGKRIEFYVTDEEYEMYGHMQNHQEEPFAPKIKNY